MRQLIIPRDRWLRGEGGENSGLLVWVKKSVSAYNDTKVRKQCCIGIYLTALGVPDEILNGHGSTDEVVVSQNHTDFNLPKEAEWQIEVNEAEDGGDSISASHLVSAMYRVNDDVNLTDMAREEILTSMFRAADPPVQVTFVNTLEVKEKVTNG